MSTDFLNRRMDLSHSLITTVGDTPSKSILTMDTSYPVKLAGKVIKLFTAANRYYKNMTWEIRNSIDELILTITTDHVYDFAGNVLNDSVGEGLPYGTESEVYAEGDYIMAVIDFDAATLHLCSETNFKNYFHGEKGGKLKLFEIDGEDDISSDTSNFPYTAISKEEFAKAVAFENDNNETHSFMRHSDDQVLWELPEQETGANTSRKMTPVAKVNNENINGLNTSIQQFIFPSINIQNCYRGFDTLGNLSVYKMIDGAVSKEFIENFGFEYDDILRFEQMTDPAWLFRFVNTIPTQYREDYYYVLGVVPSNNRYNESKIGDSVNFYPIRKSDNKFATLFLISNPAITVNGIKDVNLLSVKHQMSYLTGSYWDSDKFAGFKLEGHQTTADSNKIPFVKLIIDNGSNINEFRKESDNLADYAYEYTDYVDNNKPDVTDKANYDIKRLYYNANGYDLYTDYASNNEQFKLIKRFLDFFDDGGWEVMGNNYIKSVADLSMVLTNTTYGRSALQYITGTESEIVTAHSSSPICIVAMAPEYYFNIIREAYEHHDDNTSIINYNEQKDRFDTPISIWDYYNAMNKSLAYQLIDKHIMLNNIDNTHFRLTKLNDSSNYSCKINGVSNDYICTASQDVINGGTGLLSYSYINNEIKYYISIPVEKLMLIDVDGPVMERGDELNKAEIGLQSFMIVYEIVFAEDHIIIENNTYKIKPKTSEATQYELYTFINTTDPSNIGEVEQTIEFRNVQSGYFKRSSIRPGLNYFYYIESGEVNKLHRVKYFFRTSDGNDETVKPYDYYKDSVVLLFKQHTDTDFNSWYLARSWINANCAKNNRSVSDSKNDFNALIADANGWKTIITNIIKWYKFYPYIDKDTDSHICFYDTYGIGQTNSVDLTDRIDYNLYSGITPGEVTLNNGVGAKLSDFYDRKDYSMHEDCLAPYASNTKVNGSYIYNVASYIEYLKTTRVNEVFETDLFCRVAGLGINKEYYFKDGKYVTLYEFYLNAITRDLGKEPTRQDSYLSVSNDVISMFPKEQVNNINDIKPDSTSEHVRRAYDSNNNIISIQTDATLHCSVPVNNTFGFNPITIFDNGEYKPLTPGGKSRNRNDENVSNKYNSEDTIWISKTQTGNTTVYELALNDGDVNTLTLLNMNGILGDISIDKIKWSDMLLSLNNNKTLDILSYSLTEIKHQINNVIIDLGQNINSNIKITQNITEDDANFHDITFGIDSDHIIEGCENIYKDTNADMTAEIGQKFTNQYGLYEFNYGYGFQRTKDEDGTYHDQPWVNNTRTRELNNRGVIVFETDGFKTYQYRSGNANENPKDYWYKTVEGTIYPKRMYISRDGLVCTKQLIEKEEEWGMSLLQKLGIN